MNHTMNGHQPPSYRPSRVRRVLTAAVASVVAFGGLVAVERSSSDVAAASADTLFVAPDGNDGNDGTNNRPLATLQKAIDRADNGDRIVLASGVYHQEAMVYGKTVHIEGAGIDRTILDGARPVTNWRSAGAGWSTPWTPIAGRSDDIQVTTVRPEAAYPEQVFVDGQPLTEVASLSGLVAGTFFTDSASNRIHIADNPTGRLVEVSTLTSGLYLNRASRSTVTGLTVQRFATPQSNMAAIRAYSDGAVITDVAVRNNAYGGISAIGSDITFDRVTATYNGHNGMHGHRADRLTVTDSLLIGNNTERFDPSWAAGGIKITTSNGFTFTDSVVEGNAGPAVWTDLDVTDIVVAGNIIRGNMRSGVMLELSQRAIVADNLIVGNGQAGLYVLESTDVELWHNSALDNHWDLRILTGPRADVNRVTVSNNAFGGAVPSGQAIMHADDWTSNRSAEQMNIDWNNNRIWWPTSSNGRWISRIQNWPAPQSLSTTIDAHRRATGGQAAATVVSRSASNPFVPNYQAGDGRPSSNSGLGTPVPSNISSVLGVASGTRVGPGAITAVADVASFPSWSAPQPVVGQRSGPVYAPRDVEVEMSPTGLQVSWAAPVAGQTPSSYAIWVNGDELTTSVERATEVPPAQSGVSAVQVQSIGANGERSAKSAPVVFGESSTPVTVPPPPTAPPTTTPPPVDEPSPDPSPDPEPVYVPLDVVASPNADATITATWSAPRGGQVPLFYIVYVNNDQVATTPGRSIVVKADESGTSYVQIRAVGVGQVSVKSAPVKVETGGTSPQFKLVTPSNVRVSGNEISWSPNGSINVRFQVWANNTLIATTTGTRAVLPEANSSGVYIEVAAIAPTGEVTTRTAPVKVSRREVIAPNTSAVSYPVDVAARRSGDRIVVDWNPPTSRTPAATYNVWSNGVLVAKNVAATDVRLPPSSGDQYVQVQAVSADGIRGGKTAPVRVGA